MSFLLVAAPLKDAAAGSLLPNFSGQGIFTYRHSIGGHLFRTHRAGCAPSSNGMASPFACRRKLPAGGSALVGKSLIPVLAIISDATSALNCLYRSLQPGDDHSGSDHNASVSAAGRGFRTRCRRSCWPVLVCQVLALVRRGSTALIVTGIMNPFLDGYTCRSIRRPQAAGTAIPRTSGVQGFWMITIC